jgi:hypothetical protein
MWSLLVLLKPVPRNKCKEGSRISP